MNGIGRRITLGPAFPATSVLLVSGAVAWAVVRTWGTRYGAMQDVARACALLALTWSACAAGAYRVAERAGASDHHRNELVSLLGVVALLLGVVTAIVQVVVLTMRAASVAIDLTNGYPGTGTSRYGFGAEGMWSLLLLFAACAVGAAHTGDRRLWTCQLWCAVLACCWACLLAPVLRSVPTGGFERTANTLLLPVTLSVLLILTVLIATGIQEYRARRITAARGHDAPTFPVAWPGLASSTTAIGVAVTLLGCYHMAAPVAAGAAGFRTSALAVAVSTGTAALACYILIRQKWNASLCDAAMGLTSFCLCAVAAAAVPAEPAALAERYPMTFNAMIIGSAFATGLWTYLASEWREQSKGSSGGGMRLQLVEHAKRFAFLNAAMALVLGAAMAFWPRWPAIAAMDDSLGRVVAGFAANLFLLLVLLWSARRLHRLTFQILTVLAVMSAIGFLTVRMLPFTPQFG